jgi:hypothetical protein
MNELYRLEEQQRLETEVHGVWTLPEPKTDVDRIVNAVNALNHSLDRRIDRLTAAVLSLARVLERR